MRVVLKKAMEKYGHGGLDVAPFVCSTGVPSTTSPHWRDAFFSLLSPLDPPICLHHGQCIGSLSAPAPLTSAPFLDF